MMMLSTFLDLYPGTPPHKQSGTKYDVLTLHREFDNVCVVRLRGYENDVFWKEIKLNPRMWFFGSPRQKILRAQDKARRKAEKLRWADQLAAHEYSLAGGGDS